MITNGFEISKTIKAKKMIRQTNYGITISNDKHGQVVKR